MRREEERQRRYQATDFNAYGFGGEPVYESSESGAYRVVDSTNTYDVLAQGERNIDALR